MEANMKVDKYHEHEDSFEAFLGYLAKGAFVLMFGRLIIAWTMGTL